MFGKESLAPSSLIFRHFVIQPCKIKQVMNVMDVFKVIDALKVCRLVMMVMAIMEIANSKENASSYCTRAPLLCFERFYLSKSLS